MDKYTEAGLIAAGLIVALHDAPTIAADVLINMGLDEADCSEMDEFDKGNLRTLQDNSPGRLRLTGLTPNV